MTIEILGNIYIPDTELRFTFSRSGGPGGQNVNKVSTRVTLWFDLNGSSSLTEGQKQKIRSRLGNRMNEAGILSISSSSFRTQKANREDAVRRFQAVVSAALAERPAGKKNQGAEKSQGETNTGQKKEKPAQVDAIAEGF